MPSFKPKPVKKIKISKNSATWLLYQNSNTWHHFIYCSKHLLLLYILFQQLHEQFDDAH